MNSSCVGWMCGGTNVPGGSSVSNAKQSSLCALSQYVWPRMLHVTSVDGAAWPVPAGVIPAGRFMRASLLSGHSKLRKIELFRTRLAVDREVGERLADGRGVLETVAGAG